MALPMSNLVHAGTTDPAVLERRREVAERVHDLAAHHEIPANTRRAYAADRADYERWCTTLAVPPWPPSVDLLVSYVGDPIRLDAAGEPYELRVGTIRRRLAAISVRCQEMGLDPPPTQDVHVRRAVKALARRQAETGLFDHRKAAPLELEMLTEVCQRLDRARLADIRNRALLTLGFFGALRRSELVGLDVGDLDEAREGLDVRLRRTKTDQDGEHDPVAVPYKSDEAICPVRAWQSWRSAAGLVGGAAFRSVDQHGHLLPGRLPDNRVSAIVKAAAAMLGKDPERYSAHSLRAGFITSAAKRRVPGWAIMRHTRHGTVRVMDGYIRTATRWEENAAAMLGP
jgi:integrase